MALLNSLQNAIRPSTTQSTTALWAKSLLNAAWFSGIIMVALPWLAHRLAPAEIPIPMPMRTWLAWALAVAGIAVWVPCLDAFSRKGRGTPLPLDPPRLLVTTGLFALIRNPIAVAQLLVIWAVALHMASLGTGLYALVITVVAHLNVVYVEEPELRQRFGESHEEYCRRVPRWFPRLGGRRVGG
jgi:protein-S-isoprenylcysteine O-methyltransferase Ste14